MEILYDPAVLVSLLGSLLIALLSKRLARFGEYLITHVFLLPRRFRDRLRVKRWGSRRNLIERARGHHSVTLSIARTYAFLLIFVVSFVAYLLLITLGPLKGIGDLPFAVQAFIASPMYVAEALWLFQRDRMTTLVRIAEKRVTNRSSTLRSYGPSPDGLKAAA